MKLNRTVTWILGIALAAIWGSIGYRVIAAMSSGDDNDATVVQPEYGRNAAAEGYVYKPDVRDPFRIAPAVNRDSIRHARKKEIVWTPPPLKLTGILSTGKKRSATFQTADGEVYFLKEGDTLRGTRVLKIESQKVTYTYMKKKSEWLLERP